MCRVIIVSDEFRQVIVPYRIISSWIYCVGQAPAIESSAFWLELIQKTTWLRARKINWLTQCVCSDWWMHQTKNYLSFLYSARASFNCQKTLIVYKRVNVLMMWISDEQSDHQVILQEASKLVCNKYGVQEPTIQIEHYTSEMDECNHCQDPH